VIAGLCWIFLLNVKCCSVWIIFDTSPAKSVYKIVLLKIFLCWNSRNTGRPPFGTETYNLFSVELTNCWITSALYSDVNIEWLWYFSTLLGYVHTLAMSLLCRQISAWVISLGQTGLTFVQYFVCVQKEEGNASLPLFLSTFLPLSNPSKGSWDSTSRAVVVPECSGTPFRQIVLSRSGAPVNIFGHCSVPANQLRLRPYTFTLFDHYETPTSPLHLSEELCWLCGA